MKKHCFIILCGLFVIYHTNAQSGASKDNHDLYKITIAKTNELIKVDGELTEEVWKIAQVATDFNEVVLRDIDKAKRRTEARIAYDDDLLYISFYAYDTLPYNSTTLKRDVGGGQNDAVWICIDPLNQRTNGFIFYVSSYNIQIDDVLSANNLQGLNFTWDNKWQSAIKRYNDHWTAEMAIPFKTLRYTNNKTVWGINFYRADMKNGQYSAWTKIPINIHWADLGYYGSLVWDSPPPIPGKNVSFIPYAMGSLLQDKENGETRSKLNAGFDAKVAVTPSLNLDLTVNPDFSQVEVDQQVTNLTRFNIFFPEKRTFFLENADLYNEIGYAAIRPFYSRTIGLDAYGSPIPILGGARLSGNLTKNLRIAFMNMQTGHKGEYAAQNYTAITIKRQLLKRSGISAYFFNRQGFLNEEQRKGHPLDSYGRNAGIDARYTSNTTKWKAFSSYNFSFKPGIRRDNQYFNMGGEYSSKKVGVQLHYNDVGTNYYADMGFIGRMNNYDARLDSVIRLGFKQLFSQVEYRVLPTKGAVNNHLLGFENTIFRNPSGSLNDQLSRIRYFIEFKSRSTLKLRFDQQDTRLLYYTKLTDKEPLPPAKYVYYQWNVEYSSDFRKTFNYGTNIRQGTFYNGTLLSAAFTTGYRLQYWGNINLSFEYNKVSFPEPYGATDFFLISPRLEFYFSNTLFWTTFFQYNTQINNFNINSRLQWRYKPMSDIFLVYTDNYFSDPLLKNKNRAIVLKANYWLNL